MEKMIADSEIEGNIDRTKPDENFFLFDSNLSVEDILAENKEWKDEDALTPVQEKALVTKYAGAKHTFMKNLKKGIRQNAVIRPKKIVKWILGAGVMLSVAYSLIVSGALGLSTALGIIPCTILCALSVCVERKVKLASNRIRTVKKLEKSLDIIQKKLKKVDGYCLEEKTRALRYNSVDQYFGEDTYYEIKLNSFSRNNV